MFILTSCSLFFNKILFPIYSVGYDHESGNRTKFKEYFGESYSDAKAMWENCRAWSKSIEVVYRANKEEEILTRAYFHYDPHVRKH